MALTRNEFAVLQYLAKTQDSQPEASFEKHLVEQLGCFAHAVEQTLNNLSAQGYFEQKRITPEGLAALEPYRVKRAVLLAAGYGERMLPLTLETPKPLIRVNGTRIIDTLIQALIDAGIEEIYVVRGYLASQFDQLKSSFPQITFIENPDYLDANNISSVYKARGFLEQAYILEADLFLYNPVLIERYQYESNYLGVSVEATDDWCFNLEDGYIKSNILGGTNCYHMYGISYWSGADGARLSEDICAVYERTPGGKQLLWDLVAFEHASEPYQIAIRPCSFDDIREFDTFSELCEVDASYGI